VNMPDTVKMYLQVAKPRIVGGNLVTAAAGFLLAARGDIDLPVMLPAVIGIALAVASACVFNNCIDRDMDRKMARTRNRVLARGLMTRKAAVCYASLLGAAGMALLWGAANPLSAAIVSAGFTVYVAVYSPWLKRHSVYGTLIGSLAGAAPPLAGYCAAGGGLDLGGGDPAGGFRLVADPPLLRHRRLPL